MSHLLPALPKVVVEVVEKEGEMLHYKEWIKSWMQRESLDALFFHEPASRTKHTFVRLALI